jgi:hypothetical protein
MPAPLSCPRNTTRSRREGDDSEGIQQMHAPTTPFLLQLLAEARLEDLRRIAGHSRRRTLPHRPRPPQRS